MKYRCCKFRVRKLNENTWLVVCAKCGRLWSMVSSREPTEEEIINELILKQRKDDKA